MGEFYFHYVRSPSMVNGGGLVMMKINFFYKWTLFSPSGNLNNHATSIHNRPVICLLERSVLELASLSCFFQQLTNGGWTRLAHTAQATKCSNAYLLVGTSLTFPRIATGRKYRRTRLRRTARARKGSNSLCFHVALKLSVHWLYVRAHHRFILYDR